MTWRPSQEAIDAAIRYYENDPDNLVWSRSRMRHALLAAWKVDHPKLTTKKRKCPGHSYYDTDPCAICDDNRTLR